MIGGKAASFESNQQQYADEPRLQETGFNFGFGMFTSLFGFGASAAEHAALPKGPEPDIIDLNPTRKIVL